VKEDDMKDGARKIDQQQEVKKVKYRYGGKCKG
jgi:hypothetical protein